MWKLLSFKKRASHQCTLCALHADQSGTIAGFSIIASPLTGCVRNYETLANNSMNNVEHVVNRSYVHTVVHTDLWVVVNYSTQWLMARGICPFDHVVDRMSGIRMAGQARQSPEDSMEQAYNDWRGAVLQGQYATRRPKNNGNIVIQSDNSSFLLLKLFLCKLWWRAEFKLVCAETSKCRLQIALLETTSLINSSGSDLQLTILSWRSSPVARVLQWAAYTRTWTSLARPRRQHICSGIWNYPARIAAYNSNKYLDQSFRVVWVI